MRTYYRLDNLINKIMKTINQKLIDLYGLEDMNLPNDESAEIVINKIRAINIEREINRYMKINSNIKPYQVVKLEKVY